MKRAIYKTEKGYFGNAKCKYTDIQTFFGDRNFYYRETNGETKLTRVQMIASDDLKRQIAARFVERHFGWRTKAEKERIINAMVEKRCDLSYLQCFYTSGANSLSGEAYSYCKRKFLQSIW